MKIRNLLIIILIVVLVVVYSLVVTDYLKQQNQKATLESQVAEATASLALIPNPPADLEEQLAAAQKGFESAKDAFAIDTNDTHIVNRILEIAKENGVKAIPLATQPWVLESVLNQNYSVFRTDIAATGSYPQLVSFLNQLENSEPKTLVIEYLTVDAAPGSSLLDSATRNAQLLNADIKLAIYAPPITTSL